MSVTKMYLFSMTGKRVFYIDLQGIAGVKKTAHAKGAGRNAKKKSICPETHRILDAASMKRKSPRSYMKTNRRRFLRNTFNTEKKMRRRNAQKCGMTTDK